jgi:hypothetical protein
MDLATGTFTNGTPTEEAVDEDASSLGDDVADGEAELEDEVPGEFEAPSVPNDDINLLMSQRTTTQVEGTQDISSVAARAPSVPRTPLPIRSEYKDATYIMAMGPAIVEHVLSYVIHGSLHCQLKSITGCPNVRDMAVLGRNCFSIV